MRYHLSVLNELVLVCPLIMLRAQVFSFVFPATKTSIKSKSWKSCSLYYLFDILGRIRRAYLTLSPCVAVMSTHVRSIVIHQFQVLKSVIGLVMVFMMNSFVFGKWSSKVLRHYVAMLKNTFTVNVDSNVSRLCKAWLTFLQVNPVRIDVVGLMSKPSTAVSLTNLARSFIQYVCTTLNPTYFTSRHNPIIPGGVL